MNTIKLEDIVGSRGRVAVLRVLVNVGVPLSIRQVASQAGLSHAAAGEALDSLVNIGVVAAAQAGRSRVHWLERRSLTVQDIVLPAFQSEAEQAQRAIDELRHRIPADVYSVVLFGSRARGDNRSDSDFDLLVVELDAASLKRTLQHLDAIATEMRAALGASVSVLGYTLSQTLELAGRSPGLLEGVLRDGVTLVGVSPGDWGADREQRRTEPVGHDAAERYATKALELLAEADDAVGARRWNAAGSRAFWNLEFGFCAGRGCRAPEPRAGSLRCSVAA